MSESNAEVAVPHLRPLGIGEILDVALKIVWRNAGTLVRIVFFVVFPVQVFKALVEWSSLPNKDMANLSGRDLATLVVGFGVAELLAFLATILASGACYRAITSAYLGERTRWSDSLRFALSRLHSILWISLLSTLAAGLGLILCVIPGIYLWVCFSLAVPVLLTEQIKGGSALGRSRSLVTGHWWRCFAVVLLGTILAGIVSAIVDALVGGLTSVGTTPTDLVSAIGSIVSGTVADLVSTPFTAAFITVLYFDLRVRKEAFDLQLLAQNIGVEPPPGWAPPTDVRPPTPGGTVGGEQPPFWPPPPGWKPGGGTP
jgi:hypothetical protein